MSDRELLEFAAKAYGCNLKQKYVRLSSTGREIFFSTESGIDWTWRPFADDGDAMRLAVKLGLRVQVFLDMPFGDYAEAQHESGECFRVGHDDNGGSNNATRLAIVRAAAEIGRNMP